jgi:hypothetical protein
VRGLPFVAAIAFRRGVSPLMPPAASRRLLDSVPVEFLFQGHSSTPLDERLLGSVGGTAWGGLCPPRASFSDSVGLHALPPPVASRRRICESVVIPLPRVARVCARTAPMPAWHCVPALSRQPAPAKCSVGARGVRVDSSSPMLIAVALNPTTYHTTSPLLQVPYSGHSLRACKTRLLPR